MRKYDDPGQLRCNPLDLDVRHRFGEGNSSWPTCRWPKKSVRESVRNIARGHELFKLWPRNMSKDADVRIGSDNPVMFCEGLDRPAIVCSAQDHREIVAGPLKCAKRTP